jgi:SAM-dependent methyltransferase
VTHPAARGFDTSGERYERGRPDYPEQAVDALLSGLGSPSRVLDAGAGTGKLTRPLRARGLTVIAAEPAAAMRAVLEADEVLDASAESLPSADASVDAVVAGQAFHWFANPAALAEFARVATGDLGLIWNRRDTSTELQRALGAIIAPYRAGAPEQASNAWRAAFTEEAPFALGEPVELPNVQRVDADALSDRILSTSIIAVLPEEERARVDERVRALAPSPVELSYITEVFICARR